MKLSVLTPLHAPGVPFVRRAYESLLDSGVEDFEWIVLENHGGVLPDDIRKDLRVSVYAVFLDETRTRELEGVGALKQRAAELARGDVFVELDADDELAPGALAKVAEAIGEGADFVYSDFAEFSESETGNRGSHTYDPHYGWEHYSTQVRGIAYEALRAPVATLHNLRSVHFAPNHVRAWRRSAYEEIGGHDPRLAVGDDHDLCCRFFLFGKKFVRIPECLYLYRVHPENTVKTKNAAIQDQNGRNFERHFIPMAEKWAKDRRLALVDLCGAHDAPAGYQVLDRAVKPFPNLDKRWPLETSSVGVLRAHDAVEHLSDSIHTMNEAYRVLAPGGVFLIRVPSTNGLGAFCDPTHRSYWNKLSFRYYTDRRFARYVPKFRGRFQLARPAFEWFPSPWHRAENVPYAECELFALKDNFRAMGEVLI